MLSDFLPNATPVEVVAFVGVGLVGFMVSTAAAIVLFRRLLLPVITFTVNSIGWLVGLSTHLLFAHREHTSDAQTISTKRHG